MSEFDFCIRHPIKRNVRGFGVQIMMTVKQVMGSLTFSVLLGACSPGVETSTVQVTNGVPAAQSFPSVVQILTASPNSSGLSSCSGTFVSDSILITAAHCIEDAGNGPTVLASNRRIKHIKRFMHPRYTNSGSGSMAAFDVAVIQFPAKTFLGKPAAVSDTVLKKGDEISIVGFGGTAVGDMVVDQNGNASVPVLERANQAMMGKNIVDIAATGVISYLGVNRGTGTGVDSSSAPGDSGGAIFRGSVLTGVVSRGSTARGISDNNECDLSYRGPNSARDFLKSLSKEGIDIPFENSGSSQSGQQNTSLLSIHLKLSFSTGKASLAIGAPKDTKQLISCPSQGSVSECISNKRFTVAKLDTSTASRNIYSFASMKDVDLDTIRDIMKEPRRFVALNSLEKEIAQRKIRLISSP